MWMPVKISPSIMCSKIEDYARFLEVFNELKVDSIHFDVMDGQFVPNIMLGTNAYQDTKRLSSIPVHLHLMVTDPERALDMFDVHEGDTVYVHPESTKGIYKVLDVLQRRGAKAGVALNPGTPVDVLVEVAEVLDAVLVMTISPGFAGQKMVANAPDKITRTRALLDSLGMKETSIYVDGNTIPERARVMRTAGADGFVVGTSTLVKSPQVFADGYADYVQDLEEVA